MSDSGYNHREAQLCRWFSMWLDKADTGIEDIFALDAVYIESWGPEYHGSGKIKLWFDEWNTRGTVERWDIRQYFHKGDQTVVEWAFRCAMTDGTVQSFDGSPSSAGTKRVRSAFCRNLGATKIATTPTPRGTPRCSRKSSRCGFKGRNGMKGFVRDETRFSLCGLNCALCSMYLGGYCPGCGGGAGNQSCAIAKCSLAHGGISFCWECPEYPCSRYDGFDNGTPLSPTGTGSRISPVPRNWGWRPTSLSWRKNAPYWTHFWQATTTAAARRSSIRRSIFCRWGSYRP